MSFSGSASDPEGSSVWFTTNSGLLGSSYTGVASVLLLRSTAGRTGRSISIAPLKLFLDCGGGPMRSNVGIVALLRSDECGLLFRRSTVGERRLEDLEGGR